MKRSWLLALAIAAPVAAQETLEVIALRHRTAEQVIPILRPLLDPGAALSGQFNQLIVRTSPANLAQIRSALSALDQPLRRLEISVRFDGSRDAAHSGRQTNARISNRGSSAELRMQESRVSSEERVDQRLQVVEGGQAWIAAGESRASGQAEAGFAVVPRIVGAMVQLDIATQQEAVARGGSVQGQRAVSTVSGRVGEWIELGGAGSASVRTDAGLFSTTDRALSAERRIWVKVEELR
jgi:type II secretory pathway component GspD/PulD (secretin)